jgi:WD40 repeat protein
MLSLAQEPLFIVQENHSGLISALDISMDAKWFTTTGYDKQVRVWDMETGLLVQGFALYDVPNDVQFQEDRNYIYVGTHGITTAPLIALNMYNYGIQAGNQSSVYSFDRSKSFAFQAMGHNQGYISFFDNRNNTSKYLQLDSSYAVSSLAFSSDEKLMAAGSTEFFCGK